MGAVQFRSIRLLLCCCALALVSLSLRAEATPACPQIGAVRLTVDQGHPWRPPFGLERVGAAPAVHVELAAKEKPKQNYYVTGYRDGREFERHTLEWRRDPRTYGWATRDEPRLFAHATLASVPTEVAVYVSCGGQSMEVSRRAVAWPTLEADVAARADRKSNPVDLGTVLVPRDWLLLARGQTAVLDVAAVSRGRDLPHAKLRAWFQSGKSVEEAWPLARDQRAVKTLRLPVSVDADRTSLHVSLSDGSRDLWRKEIRTMVVDKPPQWPAFGAVETKLRYDAPIPNFDPKTGAALPSMDYNTAWDSKLNDVVVLLPNGSRFVFWRGASYCPFWAGPLNTGMNYQWAEHQQRGFVDTAEPLMDKELRYQRVRIVESTASRIHVRWNYESVDFNYQRWGDQTQEDFYFYPDGFGTRVVTLTSGPEADYELLEFLLLTPQDAFPFDVLPEHLVDVLSLDGAKQSLSFPLKADPNASSGWPQNPVTIKSSGPLIYRIFVAKDDPATSIAFNPNNLVRPPRGFPGMYEQGEAVTPAYWGSHWPLTRGQRTTWSINDDIHQGPAHLTLLHWGLGNIRPTPISSSDFVGVDTLGQSRQLRTQRWAWLIGKSDASDDEVRAWAQSFSTSPSLQLKGARLDAPAYVQERRAIRLVVESTFVEIKVYPTRHTVNPVFELDGAPKTLARVVVDGQPLAAADYAWDGATLWVKASIDSLGATIGLQFR